MELEVPDDNNVDFEKLVSRYDNFIKNISRNPDNVNKFSDKNKDLKNGLDNYFRTGSSRKESGTKKMSGDNAITAVSNMIEYCKAYINNKNTIISKIDDITSDNSDVKKNHLLFLKLMSKKIKMKIKMKVYLIIPRMIQKKKIMNKIMKIKIK